MGPRSGPTGPAPLARDLTSSAELVKSPSSFLRSLCKLLSRSWARGSRFAGFYNYDLDAHAAGTLFMEIRGTMLYMRKRDE